MTSSDQEKILHKNELKKFCLQAIGQRIAFAREAMDNAQSAANSEQKSSAGDKYETSRAMNHLEKDMHARQLVAHAQDLSALASVPSDILHNTPVKGALIRCDEVSFFIASGLGRHVIGGRLMVFLSPESPLARSLAGKRVGDLVAFNGHTKILDIY